MGLYKGQTALLPAEASIANAAQPYQVYCDQGLSMKARAMNGDPLPRTSRSDICDCVGGHTV